MALISDHSEVGIANEALSAAEVPSVLASLDQPNSKAARVCRLHLPAVRDEILRLHAFAFSLGLESVAALPLAPGGGVFTTAYAWPTEALRILSVDGLIKRRWRPEAGYRILASSSATALKVHFVKRIGDFGLWDTLARRMMVVRLAARVAPELTRHRTLRRDLMAEFESLSAEAPKIDAYEADSEQDDTDDQAYVPGYIAARL